MLSRNQHHHHLGAVRNAEPQAPPDLLNLSLPFHSTQGVRCAHGSLRIAALKMDPSEVMGIFIFFVYLRSEKQQRHLGVGRGLVRFPAGIVQGQVGLLSAVLGKRKKASLTSLFWC